MAIEKRELLDFMRAHPLGVVSTTSKSGAPEAALVNIVSTDELELIFYTIQTNRKCINLRRDPRIAVVIGWDSEMTMQYEGVADEPQYEELDRLKRIYGASRPNAEFKMSWPGLTYFRVRPKWIRLSNYGQNWSLEEMSFPQALR
jgi:pyridoxine/pyridoxamine 5'-phosphate oxidase